MSVAGVERQLVLAHQCLNPKVVSWNRRSRQSQLAIQVSVVTRSLLARRGHLHPLAMQELLEDVLILEPPGPQGKPGSQLANHH